MIQHKILIIISDFSSCVMIDDFIFVCLKIFALEFKRLFCVDWSIVIVLAKITFKKFFKFILSNCKILFEIKNVYLIVFFDNLQTQINKLWYHLFVMKPRSFACINFVCNIFWRVCQNFDYLLLNIYTFIKSN